MPTKTKITVKKATKKTVVKKSAAKKSPAKKVPKKTPTKARTTVAKKTVKKSPAKKTTQTKNKKPLVVAPNEKSFWVTNGAILNSLVALRDALDEMEREVYSYHVSKEHNDFAAWVDAVLADEKCAKDLAKAADPKKAKTVVAKHLKVYSV